MGMVRQLTFLIALFLAPLVVAEAVPASSWVGRVVITPDGELLGRIEDLAVDLETSRVEFVVVSVGSFLIDDNLIAVHPDAMGVSDDGRYLVVHSRYLDQAKRFSANNWPQTADVMADENVSRSTEQPSDVEPAREDGVVATISDGRRTATITRSESGTAVDSGVPRTRPEATDRVVPKDWSGAQSVIADSEFERLDEDGDGYLSRSEVGSRLQPGRDFESYDLDGNGGIDGFEFQVLMGR